MLKSLFSFLKRIDSVSEILYRKSISPEVLFSCPDHGHKLAEGGKQEQFSQRVRRSFIEKSASEQSGAIFIPKSRKD